MRANGALRQRFNNIKDKFRRTPKSTNPYHSKKSSITPTRVRPTTQGRKYSRNHKGPRNHSTMLSVDERMANYYAQNPDRPLTPKQRKRIRRKMNAKMGSR